VSTRVAFRVTLNKSSTEWMVHWPSGRVEFMGFWRLLRLVWTALRSGKSIQVEDEVLLMPTQGTMRPKENSPSHGEL
jgi:hypothetical protein